MYRYVQITLALCIAAFGVSTLASAQTSSAQPLAIELSGGASVGNKTSGAYGAEVDYRLSPRLALFAEVGLAGNVVPSYISDRADLIAGAIGATVDPQSRAVLFNIGAKYVLSSSDTGYQPYIGLGVGATRVVNSTAFSVNGAELTEAQLLSQYGVQLGSDLAGTTTKMSVLVAAGVARAFGSRYALDLSYRYGRVLPKTSAIEDDQAINIQRLQLGFAVRF